MNKEYADAIVTLKNAEILENSALVQLALGDCFTELKDLKNAEKCYISALNMAPNRFYPRYLLAKLYFSSNDTSGALYHSKELLSQKIKVNTPAIQEMKKEVSLIIKQLNK